MTEQELHDYNKWLMERWTTNQFRIPFVEDAPRAYLKYKNEHREYGREVPDYADLMTVEDWKSAVADGCFCNYDGSGYWVKDNMESRDEVFGTPQLDATHVAWYNK